MSSVPIITAAVICQLCSVRLEHGGETSDEAAQKVEREATEKGFFAYPAIRTEKRVRASGHICPECMAEIVTDEREACRDICRGIYQGYTEIPVKDTAAWYACAESICDEIGVRGREG